MVFRILTALLRAGILFYLLVYPTALLAEVRAGGDGVFIIFALLVAVIIFFEYFTSVPSLIEFRFAPPYNRFRLVIYTFIMLYIISVMNLDNQIGPIFELMNGVSRAGSWLFSGGWSPAISLTNALAIVEPENRAEFRLLAQGALFIAILSVLLFGLIIWLRRWPLSNAGFNLWPNMPTFHSQAGRKTETRLVQIAALSLSLALASPFLIPQVINIIRQFIGYDFAYSRLHAFWFVVLWVLIPTMAMLRAIVLLKVAYLATELRNIQNTPTDDE